MKRQLLCVTGLAALLALAGCDGKGATVTGRVTLANGKPLPGGRITFQSVAAPNKQGAGDIEPDGTYRATGVPSGECRVAVDNAHLKGGKGGPRLQVGKPPPMSDPKGAGGDANGYTPIDARFASPTTSGLTAVVKGDNPVADFELK